MWDVGCGMTDDRCRMWDDGGPMSEDGRRETEGAGTQKKDLLGFGNLAGLGKLTDGLITGF